VLETDAYTDQIEGIVNEMKEAMEDFCVSSPYFIGILQVATADVGSPSDRRVTSY
jgi:hypothetical protein